ncbi:putative cell division protein FtsL [Clostridium botulinum CFSAN002367]|nr:putative cell division protein FtsL [Clostridium botulinum CFSAN002367]
MKKINVKKLIFFLAIVYSTVIFINQQITMHKIRDQISEKKIELKEVKEKIKNYRMKSNYLNQKIT